MEPAAPPNPTPADDAEALCLACGLCCDGSLFLWAKLRPNEMALASAAGLPTFMDAPPQRGFTQPCPRHHGACALYGNPAYPHACRSYRCALLKKLQNSDITLPAALDKIRATRRHMAAFRAAAAQAPGTQAIPTANATTDDGRPRMGFRQLLVQVLENPTQYPTLQPAARRLLNEVQLVYAVMDFLED